MAKASGLRAILPFARRIGCIVSLSGCVVLNQEERYGKSRWIEWGNRVHWIVDVSVRHAEAVPSDRLVVDLGAVTAVDFFRARRSGRRFDCGVRIWQVRTDALTNCFRMVASVGRRTWFIQLDRTWPVVVANAGSNPAPGLD